MIRPTDPTRRHLVAAGFAAPALLCGVSARAAEPVTVEIANGRLRGLRDGDAVSFKGIPYGADTSGANRFMAPRPVANWTGVRDATQFGDRCIQAGRGGDARPERFAAPGSGRESENCLVLNVYAPDLNPRAKRPVMFWIHGGGFRGGAGDAPTLDGRNLARLGDVVVVTVNHRLNVFGYVPLEHLDPAFADAANAGQLDLVAALRWVRNNIGAFGGDPNSVTLFGQSGGGSKIAILQVMPEARGLFHRAINMSGPTFTGVGPAAAWEPLSNEFVRLLGLGKGDLRRLQAATPQQLLAAHGQAVKTLKSDDFRPVIDGRHIPHGPLTPQGLAMNPDMPLMIGTTDTESSYFLRTDSPQNPSVTDAQVKMRIMAQFGIDASRAQAVIDGYRLNPQNRTPWDVLLGLASDTVFRGRMLRAAEALAAARRPPVYVYNFTWRSPAEGGVWGAPHASDIPFVFGTLDAAGVAGAPGAAEASRNNMAAFVAFARTGDPNNPHMPRWLPYDGVRRATMTINATCEIVDDYRGPDRRTSQPYLGQESFELIAGPLFRYAAA